MANTLYVLANCPYCWRVWVVAEAAGAKVESKFLTYDEVRGEEYKKINPNQLVPALQTKDGILYESNAILRYLARENPSAGLYGKDPYQEALVDQWLDWIKSEVSLSIHTFVGPVVGRVAFDKDAHKVAMENIVKKFKLLEEHFKNSKYFIGDQITIPDFALATQLRLPFSFNFEEGFRKNYPNLMRWFEEVSKHPAVMKCLGRVRYCVKAFPTKKA